MFLLGIMLLVILFLHLPKFSMGGLTFLLHLFLEDLIILALVYPIQLEALVILSLLVFRFLLEVNINSGGNLKLEGNFKLGGDLNLEAIT